MAHLVGRFQPQLHSSSVTMMAGIALMVVLTTQQTKAKTALVIPPTLV